MNLSLISVRYAKALFRLANEKNELEKITNDIKFIYSHFSEVSEFNDFLNSPIIKPQAKKKALNLLFEKSLQTDTLSFLDLVVTNKREQLLESITRDYIDLYKKQKGIKSVTMYAAIPLGEEFILEIQTFLEKELNAPIELLLKEKKELIGGFILMIDGKMLDTSIASRLKQLKKTLLS